MSANEFDASKADGVHRWLDDPCSPRRPIRFMSTKAPGCARLIRESPSPSAGRGILRIHDQHDLGPCTGRREREARCLQNNLSEYA
jgi:hypothetical protein